MIVVTGVQTDLLTHNSLPLSHTYTITLQHLVLHKVNAAITSESDTNSYSSSYVATVT